MKIIVDKTAVLSGTRAAKAIAQQINLAIAERGCCRLLLSTGASQFEVLAALVKEEVDWQRVTMFHLDEYVGMPITHPASFRKYLTERFIDQVHPGAWHFVDGEGDIKKNIEALTAEIRKAPIDVALVGIGENGHIAFNDPPADFDTREAYIVVDLDKRCKEQQMGEGWFSSMEEVPDQAISMTIWQIMQSRVIFSIVPGLRKAEAVEGMMQAVNISPLLPATMLRRHTKCSLYLDAGSAFRIDPEMFK